MKYAKSGLTAEAAARLCAELDRLMAAERPFLDSALTLPALAQRLNIPSYQLSQLLNERFGESFFDFINRWRTDEAARRLRDPTDAGRRILDIAYACGFGSKAAFNAVFKKHMGAAPSRYRRCVAPAA